MAKRVLVDFDGTLCTYKRSDTFIPYIINGIPTIDAKAFIDELHLRGYSVFVYSTRAMSDSGKTAIINWCKKYSIDIDGVTSSKLPAIAYVDDRSIEYKGDFAECLRKISELDK